MEGYHAEDALFEHRFWLQILGDHGRFILTALSPEETGDIQYAQTFILAFDQLLAQARAADGAADLTPLNREAYLQAAAFRTFKLDLLCRLLLGNVKILLTPTFINHMVNELEEYLRILQCLADGRPVPEFDPLHHDILWLPDAAGHAYAIASDLDMVEKNLIRKSKEFGRYFEELFLKALEMAGYIRTNLADFPAFRRFHSEVHLEIHIFMRFLAELEEAEITSSVLDRISPLMPDHMMREECYYLTKLARSGLVPNPDCDPAKPRVES